ncbi:cyanophycinase [Pseudidiomarina sp. 1APP75-32.1]|uniref:Cyanophycinase n=1 Tax=Pseudidiomarina terrestris TaxID=2820060 RepID=A0AAW7QYA3_9GAMM|nr:MULTISPECIES: cyanophycinase [unclassified Pseudidiomarina]MDN7124843.1 cyanophycinase [Pseudidiomarina sp. 1APP75-32.1]MDN7129683.1 cyanophycinase [Pseudidiomarina sp. 1APR75-15]
MRKSILTTCLALVAGVSASLSSGTTIAQEQSDSDFFPFIAIGEPLEVCSSMAWQRCNETDWIDTDAMRSDRYVNLSSAYVERLLDDKNWTPMRRDVRDDLREALDLLHQRMKQDVISERVFLEEFTRRATRYMYDQLSEREWNMIIDYLEMRVPDDVSYGVNLAATKDDVQPELLRHLVSQARKVTAGETPHVLVLTAGQRDSLDKVNYYLQSFAAAGADASWLPLDAAVLAARGADACEELDAYRETVMDSYRRDIVHADLHLRQLAFCEAGDAVDAVRNADAIYIADGSPDLLRPLFVTQLNEPNSFAIGIAERVAEEQLVVAAAGAAVNVMTSKAMISAGTSREALKDGAHSARMPGYGCGKDDTCPRGLNENSTTYHPLGGAGLFRWATLDNQVGEEGRHGRLLRVAATNRVPMAVGIDASTALLVNLKSGDFKVVGERGVFFALGAQQNERAVAASFHYLMAGATGTLSGNELTNVELADNAKVVQEDPTTNFLDGRGMYDALRLLCNERESIEVKQEQFVLTLLGGEGVTTQKAGAECQVMNARIGMQYAPSKSF